MSEGELLQIQKNRKFEVTEETYFKIISDKTASLVTACCESLELQALQMIIMIIQLLSDFGENIGIAFQLRDDMLDYIGKKKIMGKSSGSDLKREKFTLPLIHSLNNASKKDAKEIISIVKNGSYSKSRSRVMDFIKEHNGIEYTARKPVSSAAEPKQKSAVSALQKQKETMIKFVDFISERIKLIF